MGERKFIAILFFSVNLFFMAVLGLSDLAFPILGTPTPYIMYAVGLTFLGSTALAAWTENWKLSSVAVLITLVASVVFILPGAEFPALENPRQVWIITWLVTISFLGIATIWPGAVKNAVVWLGLCAVLILIVFPISNMIRGHIGRPIVELEVTELFLVFTLLVAMVTSVKKGLKELDVESVGDTIVEIVAGYGITFFRKLKVIVDDAPAEPLFTIVSYERVSLQGVLQDEYHFVVKQSRRRPYQVAVVFNRETGTVATDVEGNDGPFPTRKALEALKSAVRDLEQLNPQVNVHLVSRYSA